MAQVVRSVHVQHEPVLLTYGDAEKPPALEPRHEAPPPLEPPPAPAPREDPAAELAELRKQAFEDGYRDGCDAGAKKLEELLGSVHDALGRQIEGLEDVIVEIAFAAVCKLLGEAALSDDGVRNLVREAMRGARTKEGLVVRVAPADHGLLAGASGIEVVADERVALGGCIIETAGGTLDARLEVQLQQLLDTLTRARSAQAE